MSRKLKAPTLRDIAETAGVSLYTASVVLNGSRSNTRVSEDTRERIRDIARAIGYHPNAMAQGLVRRRVNTVGVLLGFLHTPAALTNSYTSAVLQGIVTAAFTLKQNITLFSEPWQNREQSANQYRDGSTDGVIAIAPVAGSDVVPSLHEIGVRLVSVAFKADEYGVPSVDVDNVAGIRMATRHLMEQGHRRIAHLRGNADMVSVPVREGAFLETMQEAGLVVPDTYRHGCSYDGAGVYEAMAQLYSLPAPPTALVAGNDMIAITAIRWATEQGIAVPEQLSVVGFDDISLASAITPGLTTIRQPLNEIGTKAMQLLFALIEGASVNPVTHLLEPELILRHSTAPVSGA